MSSAPHTPSRPFDVAMVTDCGSTRLQNEDYAGFVHDSDASVIVAVADGVSGGPGAGAASKIAVETLLRSYREQAPALSPARRLQRAVQQANIEVHDRALAVPELRGMTTTLTAVVVHGRSLTAVHIGDCRLYHVVQDGNIRQLTQDHTVVAERVRLRVLSAKRAQHHPRRSVLTRSLGAGLIAATDRIGTSVCAGDRFVICSDGLYNTLNAREIATIACKGEAQTACQALVDEANARGTQDNLTAALIRIAVAPLQQPTTGLFKQLRRFIKP